MPRTALPPHLQDFDWGGTDNASWLMRQKKKVQILVAAGPRVPSGFFKWREFPIVLFAFRGEGLYRTENTDGSYSCFLTDSLLKHDWVDKPCNYHVNERVYLSRIQPWCRWHISLQWPLFFNCHFIYRTKNVVRYPKYQSAFGITKMFTFGIGFKRDADKVYWITANLGGNFE